MRIGYVMTMDGQGTSPRGDVHIADGAIVEVGWRHHGVWGLCSGITIIYDWRHNVREPEYAEAVRPGPSRPVSLSWHCRTRSRIPGWSSRSLCQTSSRRLGRTLGRHYQY